MNDLYQLHQSDAMGFLLTQSDGSVDMVFTSPPYALKCRRYPGMPADAYIPSNVIEWVRWIDGVINECCRVSRGMVFVVVDSPRKDGEYKPAVEGLLWTLATDNRITLRTPHIWHKNGAPGGTKYPGHDWESIIACHARGVDPFYDPKAIGHAAKFDSGPGRQRKANGERSQAKAGVKKGALARPRDVIRCTVGGGHMGRVGPNRLIDREDDKLACSGEAPFPVRLADHFLRGWCPPGGRVLDPFFGTVTTAVSAIVQGKTFIGCDARASQIEIATKRLKRMEAMSCVS